MDTFEPADIVRVVPRPTNLWVATEYSDTAVPASEVTVLVFAKSTDPNADPRAEAEAYLSIRALLDAYNFKHGTDY